MKMIEMMQDTTSEDIRNTRIICNNIETTEQKNYKSHFHTDEFNNKCTMNTHQCNTAHNKYKWHDYILGT
jgi:hypothetical protein